MKLVLPTLYCPTMSTMGFASKSAGFMGGEWKCAYRLDSSSGRIWRCGSGGEGGQKTNEAWNGWWKRESKQDVRNMGCVVLEYQYIRGERGRR